MIFFLAIHCYLVIKEKTHIFYLFKFGFFPKCKFLHRALLLKEINYTGCLNILLTFFQMKIIKKIQYMYKGWNNFKWNLPQYTDCSRKKGVLSAWLILIYQINNLFFNECQEKFAISRKNDFCEYLVYTVLIKSKNLEFWYDLIFDLCMTKKKLINIQIHDRFWNSSFKVHWQGPKFDPPWK